MVRFKHDSGSELTDVDFTGIGPKVGERFPDVVLPDQSGRHVDLHEHRGGRRAVVAVHRSADW